MTLKGTLLEIGDVQTFANDFQKKEIVLKIDEDSPYPQEVPIELIKKNMDIVNVAKVGDVVEVDINIRGSEYNGRRFISFSGWKLSVIQSSNSPVIYAPQSMPTDDLPMDEGSDDGLPF